MDLKKKLVITLFVLSCTTILAIMSLIFVLVDNPQGFNTDFDIVYTAPKIGNISFSISGVENEIDFENIVFENSYLLQEPAIPKVHNKMLVGWYLDESLTTKAEFPITVTESTTLYPYFKDGNVDSYIEWNTAGYYQIKNTKYTKVDGVTECVIPDYYDDGTNGLYSLTTIVPQFLNVSDGSGITDVYVGNNVSSLPNSFANQQITLTNVVLGSNLTNIGNSAFYGCSELVDINIPYGVTNIGMSAFKMCSNLRSIVIPDSVISLGITSFDECINLTSVIIGNNITSLSIGVFSGCSSLTNITIPDSVITISGGVFNGCSSLVELVIPSSVTYIGMPAFNLCDSLSTIVVDSANTIYDSRDNCNAIIQKADNKIILGCKNTVIPSSVTCVGEYAFAYLDSLTSFTIPSNIKEIEPDAFSSSGLTSLTFESPNGWTKASNSSFTSNVTNNISLSSPSQNATWFTSTRDYYGYYWKHS